MINTKLLSALRMIAGVILLQTLYYKFTGAEESVWIFEQLGVEPWGRIGSGVAELICTILILMPKTTWLGALGTLGIMSGAILSHLLILGIEVQGDGGLLFALALLVMLCSVILLWHERSKLLAFIGRK